MTDYNIMIRDKDNVIDPAMHRSANRLVDRKKIEVYEDEEGRYWRKDSKEIEVEKSPAEADKYE